MCMNKYKKRLIAVFGTFIAYVIRTTLSVVLKHFFGGTGYRNIAFYILAA